MRNARVFPLPVTAFIFLTIVHIAYLHRLTSTTTSLLPIKSGMVDACTGVIFSNPILVTASRIHSERGGVKPFHDLEDECGMILSLQELCEKWISKSWTSSTPLASTVKMLKGKSKNRAPQPTTGFVSEPSHLWRHLPVILLLNKLVSFQLPSDFPVELMPRTPIRSAVLIVLIYTYVCTTVTIL